MNGQIRHSEAAFHLARGDLAHGRRLRKLAWTRTVGHCPLSFGFSPTTAISTLPLPAAFTGPGGALGGGGAPLENDGAPMPSGSAARADGSPRNVGIGQRDVRRLHWNHRTRGTLAGRRRNKSFARLRDLHWLCVGLLRFVHVPVWRGRRDVRLRRFHALRVRFVDLRFGLWRRGRAPGSPWPPWQSDWEREGPDGFPLWAPAAK